MSLLKPNLLVSKLIRNCNSVSFLCLVSLKLPFKMQTLRQPNHSPNQQDINNNNNININNINNH